MNLLRELFLGCVWYGQKKCEAKTLRSPLRHPSPQARLAINTARTAAQATELKSTAQMKKMTMRHKVTPNQHGVKGCLLKSR